MASGTSIGMMDPAYFVGRRQILEWLNSTFQTSLSKIEQTASGAIACQIMDMVYPGTVPMSKVRWDAKSGDQFIHNYKILQRVFEKRGIDKHIDVTKLIRAKYQDNLEFMQWMKSFFDHNCATTEYDALDRRGKGRGSDSNPLFLPSADGGKQAAATGQLQRRSAPSGVIQSGGTRARRGAPQGSAPARRAATGGAGGSQAPARSQGNSTGPARGGAGLGGASARKVAELNKHVAELKLAVEGLERERDFYYGKLRDVEILLQTYTGADTELVDKMFKIMYATEEDFVTVDEQGNEVPAEQVAAEAVAQVLSQSPAKGAGPGEGEEKDD